MRKSWVVVSLALLGLGFFVSAHAQTKYFYIKSSGGSDVNTGRTFNTAWASINRANTAPQAATNFGGNDSNVVFYLCPSGVSGDTCASTASFAHFPNPAVAATGGKRYYFRPICNASITRPRTASTRIQIPTGTLSKNYVSIRGLYINGFLRVDGGRDSVVDCVIAGSFSFQNSNRSVVNNCDINGKYVAFNGEQPNVGVTMACELSDSRAPNLSPNSTCACFGGGNTCAKPAFWLEQHTDSCLVYRNRFTITQTNLYESNKPILIKYSRYNTLRGNRFDISLGARFDSCGNEPNWWMVFRDSMIGNTLRADTFFVNNVNLGTGVQSTLFGSGNYPNSCSALTLDSCYIKVNKGDALYFQNPMKQVNITNSIIFSGEGHALRADVRVDGPMLMENNTFVGDMPSLWTDDFNNCEGWNRINADNAGGSLIQLGYLIDTCKVFSNIFVNKHPGHRITFDPFNAYYCDHPFAMNYGAPSTLLKAQWNCYYTATYKDSAGDGSIGWDSPGGMRGSYPGRYGRFKNDFPTATSDSFSVFGDPQLGGINATALTYANFEPWLGVGSRAASSGKSGTSSGAVQYAAAGIPRIAVTPSSLSFMASVDNPGYSATQNIIIRNTTDGTADLVLTGLSVSHSTYMTVFLTKATIGVGDTCALVVNIHNTPTSGSGTWQVSFDTNDPVSPGFDIPVYFRQSRRSGRLEP